jgi:DHA3 family macrolide efflux protein-like MFS transporter
MLLGGLVLSVWGGFKRRIYTSLGGLVVGGLGILALGLVPANALPLAMAALFVFGFMQPLINGPLMAILQSTVAPEMQGRVFTLVRSLASAMMPLGLAVSGPVADQVGVRPWYIAGGAVFAAVGLLAFFIRPVVNIEQGMGPVGSVLPIPAAQAVPSDRSEALARTPRNR